MAETRTVEWYAEVARQMKALKRATHMLELWTDKVRFTTARLEELGAPQSEEVVEQATITEQE
jgi:hypothetical protein